MIKRIFDVSTAAAVLTVFSSVLLIVAIAVAIKLGRPVIFKQARPGLNGRPFRMLKFRSMADEKDPHGNLLSDAVRLTKFGKMLRATSLDELPGLWNVFCGQMSLVGPRPLLMEYLPLYSTEQARRHEVRPGLTGWAQVNGRNALSWDEKFALDVWYVDNQSFWLDIRILGMTVAKVLRRDGITAEGSATAEKFRG
ncbi:sugar transferase [Devosia psychrophila]|uniref:Sugar transferase involved in LPS biosynthesis (Colanic, teichoic acid) n=1 Tax=Devosia psychrophila TaxID=728005 RepID=A0A1I1RWW1_9HYPH|nr:sugar transferase [Devosia psychrophila]SFD35140.1 Sugar transferase involved in LPS biosynthesis (colanic, teichoic acid) [Devosia psychrophila]